MKSITEIYDLFEKDFYSDLQALTNTAKRISGNTRILIQFNQGRNLVFTDGSFIYLPSNIKSRIKVAQGLVAHEAGHIGYGSYELSFMKLINTLHGKYSLPKSLIKLVINAVEDVRINAINNKKFPGFYRNLRDYTIELLPEIVIRIRRTGDLLLYINLFMEDYEDFQKKPTFRTITITDEDWNVFKVSKKFLLKSLTPSSSIITSDQICKIIRKYFVRRKQEEIRKRESSSNYRNEASPSYSEDYDYDEDEYYDDYLDDYDKSQISCMIEDFDEEGDFLEDPYYFEDSDSIQQSYYQEEDLESDIFFNHVEDFNNYNDHEDNPTLDKSSDEMIQKLKDMDLNSGDLEEILDRIEDLENKKRNAENSLGEYLEDSLKDKDENISIDTSQERIPDESHEQDTLIRLEDIDEKTDILGLKEEILPVCDSQGSDKEKENINDLFKIIVEAGKFLDERLTLIENGKDFTKLGSNEEGRKVNECFIEIEKMDSIDLSYNQIITENKNLISKIKFIFNKLRNNTNHDNFQKSGRLNNKFIKAVTSDYKYLKCFTKKIRKKELKLLLLVDISGSMKGIKLECAKIAMVMLCEALEDIANIKIVLFTGDYHARDILVKNFDEPVNIKKFDKFGCHKAECSNLDGVSIKHEASKLTKDEFIIVISDGQPAGAQGYGLNNAIKEIQDVSKRFRIFAFSIDAKGEHLNKLYGKNWIVVRSSHKNELGDKLTNFCKFIVKEFFG